jgi:hypothetical protein
MDNSNYPPGVSGNEPMIRGEELLEWEDHYKAVTDDTGKAARFETRAEVEEWLETCRQLQDAAKAAGHRYVEGSHGSIRNATFPDMRERIWSVIESGDEDFMFAFPGVIDDDAAYYILSTEPVRPEHRDTEFLY